MTSQVPAPLRLVPPLDAARASTVPTPRPPGTAVAAIEPLGDGAAPGATECLPCYVDRLVAREGCDGTLRWSVQWRDTRAPRAAKLEVRLADRGGFCDCEVLFNVYPGHFPPAADLDVDDEADHPADDEPPPCAGRTGGAATDPCRPPVTPWWA